MNKFLFNGAIAIISVASLIGCARIQPVYNVSEDSAPSAVHGKKAIDTIGHVIKKAAIDEGWTINHSKPGEIICTIRWREHAATASIHYTSSNYTIELLSSKNLNQTGDAIHRNYNKRVAKLQKLIDQRLSSDGRI